MGSARVFFKFNGSIGKRFFDNASPFLNFISVAPDKNTPVTVENFKRRLNSGTSCIIQDGINFIGVVFNFLAITMPNPDCNWRCDWRMAFLSVWPDTSATTLR